MKQRLKGWRVTATAAIAVMTSLTACTAGSTDSGGGGGSGNGPVIRIGVGIDASYAPFFVADEKGLFEKQGVNVEVVQFGRGGDAVNAIATGKIQLSGSSETTTIGQLHQNPDLRALLVYEESGEYLKVVVGKDIDKPSQIKKMAIVPGLSQVSAIKFLQSKHIDPDSVEFVPAAPPEIPSLLKKGDVDAYVLWEPWPAKGVELGGKIFESTGDYGWAYVHWLITSNKWVSAHQEEAAKVAKALDQAAKETEKDPKAAAEVTKKVAKVPTERTISAIEQIDFKVRDITSADLKGYGTIADFYVKVGKLKTKPDVRAAVLQNWFSQHTKG